MEGRGGGEYDKGKLFSFGGGEEVGRGRGGRRKPRRT